MQSLVGGPSAEAGGSPRPSFAVVLTWPELKNAEYEVVQRVCRAAANIGVHAWVVDNDGYALWSNTEGVALPKGRLTRDDCAFVLSLHFESPRLYDIPTYTALWNPPDYYVGFGYSRVIAQLASHTDVLSCRSEIADAHAANTYAGLGRAPLDPFPRLFHGVPRPYLEPRQDGASRLFYVGINWERVTGEKGRHHDLLKQLDAEDLISIYGPEKLFGIAPWRGFATYRGSIPFDGESVVSRINEAGICLALSSKAHQVAGIMSNRLFEALAAGAVVIANPHPFVEKYFADVVHVVDDRRPVAEMVAQIRELVLRIRSDPAEARARAKLGQERLAEAFSLEGNLTTLFAVHHDRLAHFERETLGTTRHEVSVILDVTGADLATATRLVTDVSAQTAVTVDLLVLGAATVLDSLHGTCGPAIRSTRLFPVEVEIIAEGKVSRRSGASGRAFAEALAAVQTPFFCTMQADDHWFSEHLATLAHALSQSPESSFACSGKLEEKLDKEDVSRRHFESLTFEHFEAIAEGAYPRDAGRFLFRSSLIAALPQTAFALLDTLEHRLLMLWAFLSGMPAQTHCASYVRALEVTTELPLPLFDPTQQQEVIRDTVRGRQDWLALVSSLRQFRPAVPVVSKPATLTLGRPYPMRKGGDGLPLIKRGFSAAEESGIWIEGREGVLAFEIDEADTLDRAEIVLTALARVANKGGAAQCCSVVVNGQVAGRVVVGTQPAQFRVPVPATVDLHPGVSVTLRLSHADQVVDESGAVLDERRLGLHLVAFAMEPAPSPQAATLALDRLYDLKAGGDGSVFAAEGFSQPDADVTWVHGPVAVFSFKLEASRDDLELVLVGMRRNAAEPCCTISVDGGIVGQVTFPGDLERKTVPLPAVRGGRDYRITLDLRGAAQERNGHQGLTGIALQHIGVFRRPVRKARLIGLGRLRNSVFPS